MLFNFYQIDAKNSRFVSWFDFKRMNAWKFKKMNSATQGDIFPIGSYCKKSSLVNSDC